MDLRKAQQVAKKMQHLFGAERWYKGVGMRFVNGEAYVEVSVDPMCKKLAREAVPESLGGVRVAVL